MRPANFIFYLLVFIGFFLPTNNEMYIPISGVLLKVNEIAFLLLPIVNLWCSSDHKKVQLDHKLSNLILLFLIVVFISEFIFKPLYFDQSIMDSFRSFRLGLPLYSSLVLLLMGIKADIKVVWKVLLYAVGISVILSILSVFIDLPIYYELEEEDVLANFNGRIMNANASFGIIGLYLLFTDDDKWYNQGKLVKYVSILSIVAIIITFNRTYMALLFLELLYLVHKTFSAKTFQKVIKYSGLLLILLLFMYTNFSTVQRQLDKRVFSIVFQETSIVESTINSNRDQIYEGMAAKVSEGYWVVGMPHDVSIFIKNANNDKKKTLQMKTTDTSLVNILLIFGFIPFFVFLLIYFRMYRLTYNSLFKIIFFIYLFASLNTDSLMRQNSIFFLITSFLIINFKLKPNDESSLYSKNRS